MLNRKEQYVIESIEEVVRKTENELQVQLIKIKRKKVIYDGCRSDSTSVILISPYSKLHEKGCGWVDITKKQRDLTTEYNVAVIVFRLPKNTYYVDFKKLRTYLTEKYIMYNKREGEHWKLYIWPTEIQIRKCPNRLKVLPNNLQACSFK